MIDPAQDRTSYELFESFAVELARLAGERMLTSLDDEIVVGYKDPSLDDLPPRDAVTNVDRQIELEQVERLRGAFPDHAILAEEGSATFPEGFEYAWVVDPIDGTQNFVNGLPIFSSSVALLRDGVPVVGAIWGASSHRLRPGVYHTRIGGNVRFDGVDVGTARPSRGRQRGLGAIPHDEDQRIRLTDTDSGIVQRLPWDRRHVGSGALEAAFVAAGVFDSAYNIGPRVWDVAAGILLVQSAGRGVWTVEENAWVPLVGFPHTAEGLVAWRQPVLLATDASHARLVLEEPAPADA